MLTHIYVTKDDNLPSTICFHCANQLIQAERIKKKCISSDKLLKKQQRILSDVKIAENNKSCEKIISKITDGQQDNDINNQNFNESMQLHDDLKTINDTNSNENGNSHDPLLEVSNYQNKIRVKSVESINENAKDAEQLFSRLPELYICVVCSSKYDLKAFRRHQIYHASNKVKCPICWEEIVLKSIKEHVLHHKEKHELKCGECGSSFKDLENLFPHVLSHNKKTRIHIKNQNVIRNYVFQCNLCDNQTTSQTAHQHHMQGNHNTTDEYPFNCKICSKRFSTKAGLIQHCQLYHKYKRSTRGTFTCAHCDKIFSTKECLQRHMRLHTGERPYQCEYCDQRFSYLAAANLHKLMHTGEKNYLCSVCGKAFKQFSALQYHENMHADSRPHACKICKRAFRVKGALSTHMKIHGEKKFRCEICDRAFTMRCILTKHMKKKHKTLQESINK